MKKKFLSLMMAAAVVATTSVSAFAAENNVTMPDSANVITRDDKDAQQNVTITGKIMDNNGNMPADTFKVTVPTAASFTVNQKGVFAGPTLEIKNSGSQTVEVSAQSFTRIGSGDITITDEAAITTANAPGTDDGHKLDRKTVSLKLVGEENVAAYLSPGKFTGVYKQADLAEQSQAGDDGVKLLTLDPGTESQPTKKTITLSGSAGTKSVDKPVSDQFRLTLKIKKVVKK